MNTFKTLAEALQDEEFCNALDALELTKCYHMLPSCNVRGDLYRVDLDLLAKICFALNCSLNDIIHYEEERTVQRKNQENDMKNTRKILDKV